MLYENRYQRFLELGEIDRLIKKGEISFDEVDMVVFKDTKKRCIGCNQFLGDNDESVECPQCEKDSKHAFEMDEHRADSNCEL